MSTTAVEVGHVVAIAQDVFTAMVDHEPGGLSEDWEGMAAEPAQPVFAWVDILAEMPLRVLVTLGRASAEEITRAVMLMDHQEPVEVDDLTDALGEVANVIGGNVKSLVPAPIGLTLPQVTIGGSGPLGGHREWLAALRWRGEPLSVSLCSVENYGKDEDQ